MRLLTFRDSVGESRFGVEADGGIVDVALADSTLPADLMAFLQLPEASRSRLGEVIVAAPQSARVPDDVLRLPPILRPGKILCIGINYREHADEMNAEAPPTPEVFPKFSTTLVGDGAEVLIPEQSESLDYEAELALVIGKTAYHVDRAHALTHVAGYMAFNDLTIRDVQMRTRQWTLGKNFDTHGPCGPALVTPDAVGDPQTLAIQLTVNGEVLQQSNTSQMIFGCAELIELLSHVMTLEVGDIIATGTPSGVGAARKPPRWLRVGDVVRIDLERVGVLSNVVRKQRSAER